MQPLRNIAVIASDRGLLSSLVFSLEVAGYHVLASEGWPDGGLAGENLACTVVDASAYAHDPQLRQGLEALDLPLVYLSDDFLPLPELPHLRSLLKPFQGPDLLALVERQMRPQPIAAPVSRPAID